MCAVRPRGERWRERPTFSARWSMKIPTCRMCRNVSTGRGCRTETDPPDGRTSLRHPDRVNSSLRQVEETRPRDQERGSCNFHQVRRPEILHLGRPSHFFLGEGGFCSSRSVTVRGVSKGGSRFVFTVQILSLSRPGPVWFARAAESVIKETMEPSICARKTPWTTV